MGEMMQAEWQKRETELLAANNLELERRRQRENEANQYAAEIELLRGECIRLRDRLATLSEYIEQSASDIPEQIVSAMDDYFPRLSIPANWFPARCEKCGDALAILGLVHIRAALLCARVSLRYAAWIWRARYRECLDLARAEAGR